jgi:hypothetical protein
MKVFLCSTSYDLEDIRAMIVQRFGKKHEFIYFEAGGFPKWRGLHSHDQCIEAVKEADVVLCIIDKRYGGRYRGANAAHFPDQEVSFQATVGKMQQRVDLVVPTKDLSVSWCELITAYRFGHAVITFARQRTWDEKATRRKNQDLVAFQPAHVDDLRVFDLLDWITKQPKDNWITPFREAADLELKLEEWFAGMNKPAAKLVTAKPRQSGEKHITVIVEGNTDERVVKAIASKLALNRPLSLVVAQGKRPLLGNLKVYARAFKDSAGIIVLTDSDTLDAAEIETQKAQFQRIIGESERPDTRLVFAVPEIEAWLGKTAFRRDPIRNFNKLFEELHHLETRLEERARAVPSLKEFIDALRAFDGKAEEHLN